MRTLWPACWARTQLEDARILSPAMGGRTNSLSILDGTAGELLEERAVLPRFACTNSPHKRHMAMGKRSPESPDGTMKRGAAEEMGSLGVVTWNLGGGSETKCQEFLPGQLAKMHFVLLQEATQTAVDATPTVLKGWTLVLHKHDTEWRGQGIMVRDIWGNLTWIQGAPGVLTAIVLEPYWASFRLTFHPKLPWMRQKTCCPVLGTCRPCNNPASFWVLTAMRPSTLRGKRSDPEQRAVKRFLYGRSAMIFDFHSSRALFHPTSLITLPNNHAGSTTSG